MIYGIMIRVTEENPLEKMFQERKAKAEANQLPEMPKEFEWQWNSEPRKYQAFPAAIQFVIESAKKRGDPNAFFHIDNTHAIYFIDFSQMKQIRMGDDKLWRKVRRLEGEELKQYRENLCIIM